MTFLVELKPLYANRKSFYGKAYCIHNKKISALKSYDTVVVVMFHDMRTVTFPWGDWSATTGAHVKEFLQQVNLWDKALEVMNEKGYKSLAQFMRSGTPLQY